MRAHTIVILLAAAAVSATASRGEWKMRVHHFGEADEYFVSTVDSLTFYDEAPGMAFAPAGTFTMGSPLDEPARDEDEVQHQVTLTRFLFVSNSEVVQAEWQAVMGWNDSYFPGPHRPVEQVTWYDCIAYCNRRSASEGLDSVYVMTGRSYSGVHITGAISVACDWDGNGYRLPTEAEWEYACRAGSSTAFCNGGISGEGCLPPDPNLDLVGWYCGNASDATHEAGGKAANAWGLRDVHGNAWEWCWDRYGTYPAGPVADPVGPASGGTRVMRGGSWRDGARMCRSAMRFRWDPYAPYYAIGLRVVRTAGG